MGLAGMSHTEHRVLTFLSFISKHRKPQMLPWKICLLVRKQLRYSNKKSFRELLPSNALMKPFCSAPCWGLGSAALLSLDFMRSFLCFVSFYLFLSDLLSQKCWKSIFSLEILIAWYESTGAMSAGVWLSQNHCQLGQPLCSFFQHSCVVWLLCEPWEDELQEK